MTRHLERSFALSMLLLACSDGDGSGAGGQTAGQGGAAGAVGTVTGGAGAGGSGGSGGVGGTGGSPSSGGAGGLDGGPPPGDSGLELDGGMAPDASDPGTVTGEPEDEASALFEGALRTYDLLLAPEDLAALNASPQAEQYVPGMITIDGEAVGPVGIRYKGSTGAWQPPCTNGFDGAKGGKCSIKVAFDFEDEKGRYLGLRKLNFHSMNHDPSQLRERLVYAMFRENGVAAPRATHARVLINGQLEGLFVAIEQVDGRFTRARFSEGGEGNLYKEVWPMHDDAATYLAALESNREEMPSAARMLAFKAAIEEGPEAAEAWLDRDYFLRYLAADRVTINDDGALHWWCVMQGQGNNPGGIGNHNYYWYEGEHADRLWIIPWDVDMALAGNMYITIMPEWRMPGMCTCEAGGGGGFGLGATAAVCDPLVSTWASWREDYEAAVDTFIAGPFSDANVTAKLDAWSAQIDATVRESEGLNGAPLHADWQAAAQSLRSVINAAREHRGTQY